MTHIPPRFKSKIPQRIQKLEELAYNLWWSWHKESRELWRTLDLPLWRKTNHNPIQMLNLITDERLSVLAQDPSFLLKYDSAVHTYDKVKKANNLWFSQAYPEHKRKNVAYLSMEFAIHHSLPIYSGGLGVLSGDHCKETSDLGIPFVAVGFMYYQGYFTQSISSEGKQIALYETTNFAEETALHPVQTGKNNEELLVEVSLGDRTVTVKVWHLNVGKTDLFLMDTDLEVNSEEDRKLSYRLYDTDRDLRLRQEIVFGIGSVKVLRALGINPTIWHINEGHSAFTFLELIRELTESGLRFEEAKQKVREISAFTTHTPVPAGHEEFDIALIEKYLSWMAQELRITLAEMYDFGRYDGTQKFNMSMLAFSMTSIVNGVSQLNAETMNKQLKPLWSRVYEKPPIVGITNGVHVPTWISGELKALFDKYIGTGWIENHDNPTIWERIYDIPDRDLWKVRRMLKFKMLNYIRDRARHKWGQRKITADQTLSSGVLLDSDTLTIGFARRFAPYKRATLLFKDLERLKTIINNPYRPVQFIFAGKSHPDNYQGIDMIQEIYKHCQNPELSGRIVFLEDYGLNVARFMIHGCDIWMNNPRRPLEASGTSGQKAAMNGVPNFSVLDGWWNEGYNGRNGWVIGSPDSTFDNPAKQDEYDSESLYSVLESEIIPLFYQRDNERIPRNWLEVVRESIKSTVHQYSTRRMIKEYVTRVYNPLFDKNE